MQIKLAYATFKTIFRHNADLFYTVDGTGVVSIVTPLQPDDGGDRVYYLSDPPSPTTFASDFPAAAQVASIAP